MTNPLLEHYRDRVRAAQEIADAARRKYLNCDAANQWDTLRAAAVAAEARLNMARTELRRIEDSLSGKPQYKRVIDPHQPELL